MLVWQGRSGLADEEVHVPTACVPSTPEQDAFGALAECARLLAVDGAPAVPGVLDRLATLLSDRVGGRVRVLLRTPGRRRTGTVIARVEQPTPLVEAASPVGPTVPVEVPLRSGGRVSAVLAVRCPVPLTAGDLALVQGFADLLALALDADRPRLDAARYVLDEEDERAEISAALHEGPVQSLVAARYALETVASTGAVDKADTAGTAGTGDAAAGPALVAARAVVQQSLDDVRRVLSPLRARALSGDVVTSLRRLLDDLRRHGCAVRLVVVRPSQGVVSPACAVTAYRIVAAALHGVTGPATVAVDCDSATVTVTVTGARDPVDAGALARWTRRVAAFDGRLERHLDGVTLELPTSLPVIMTSGAIR